jgi:hypothetical protein
MAKPLAEDTADIALLAEDKALPQPEITAPAGPGKPDTLVRHACLVAEYTSYMAAAGYSTTPVATAERNLGAWSFLSRFPQPEAWLELPAAEQMRLPPRERNFVHYLFLRHVLPLPPAYALMAGPHLGDMARRLLERDTYQRYREAALRLGYAECTIRRQFQSLLCLMAWAQKPLDSLTREDVEAFVQALQVSHQESEDRGDISVLSQDGLPRSWSHQLGGLRRVLSQLGAFLEPAARRRRKHNQRKLAGPTPAQRSRTFREDSTSPQSRLVAEYTSHMAAAGYSTTPSAMTQRSLGAWSFLSRFPQPEAWLDLPLEKQVRLRPAERHFLHYLFLRHLLPMPSGYILVAGGWGI